MAIEDFISKLGRHRTLVKADGLRVIKFKRNNQYCLAYITYAKNETNQLDEFQTERFYIEQSIKTKMCNLARREKAIPFLVFLKLEEFDLGNGTKSYLVSFNDWKEI